MPKYRTKLTAERLIEIRSYNPETGIFSHRVPNRNVKVGDPAGAIDSDGYINMSVDGTYYRAHRLAWLYVHGCWPAEQIDHINGCRADNRIVNLREATNTENGQNRAVSKNNKAKRPGVTWNTTRSKWQAEICANKQRRYLGSFDCPDKASAAYAKAKSELHGFQPITREVNSNE